jgi:hypothetical protein
MAKATARFEIGKSSTLMLTIHDVMLIHKPLDWHQH